MTPISIAIAGCGPAGLAAALFLKRAGHQVTLYERFDVPKPLGSGLMLQPTGLAVLADLGLNDAINARGSRIARLEGRSVPSGRLALNVGYADLDPAAFGLAVHRASLFGVLHDAVELAGIPIRAGVEIARIAAGPGRTQCLITAGGEQLGPFDLIVDALGTRSPLPEAVYGRSFVRPLPFGALWASLPWPEGAGFADDVLEQRYHQASIMVGVLPIGRRGSDLPREAAFFWSLKPEHYSLWRERGLDAWKAEVRAIWPQTQALLDQITDPDQLVLARYGHHTLPVGRSRKVPIAFIGDSAHSASPQLGQGANMALIDALALSLALEGASDVSSGLRLYGSSRRRHVAVYQAMSRMFTPFFQSDSTLLPALRDTLVAPMSRMPFVRRLLAALVAGTVVEPITSRAHLTPSVRRLL